MADLIKAAGSIGESFADFHAYKETFDNVLVNTANNFVRIGYLLKYARDTEILKESGYESLTDFAKAEYGLDKTQVSRFIAINDRFSKGSYGDVLEDKYVNFGYAKLSIMLTLPEQITEDLTPEMTKAEITDLKKEVDAELQISDIEVALEDKEKVAAEITETGLVIREMVKSYPKLYKSLHSIFGSEDKTRLPEELAPNGKDLYVVRVAGVGKFTVTADKTTGLSIVNMRSLEKTSLCWKETEAELTKWFNVGMGAAASWESFFGTKLESEEKPVIDTKPTENEQKTAKTDNKPLKTDENSTKPNKTESKPEKKRVHKPEKVEKKTEEPAPQEEAETSGQPEGVPVDPEEKFFGGEIYFDKEPAADFMPEPVEEIGTLEVAPVQPITMDTKRIIEVREEIDLGRFKIDASADIKTQIQQVDLAIRLRLRHMEVSASCIKDFFGFHPSESIMFSGNVPATRKDWVTSFVSNARGIEEAAHDVELLNDYLRELELREDE